MLLFPPTRTTRYRLDSHTRRFALVGNDTYKNIYVRKYSEARIAAGVDTMALRYVLVCYAMRGAVYCLLCPVCCDVAMVFVKAGFKMKTDYKESEFSTNVSVHCSHKNTPNSTQPHITNGWACQVMGRAKIFFFVQYVILLPFSNVVAFLGFFFALVYCNCNT